jgi:photosystem II stability/assembly factor-like uncharacterized protein
MMNWLIATTGTGVARARRDGARWVVETELEGEDVTCLAADPQRKGVVYAGTRGNGILRSEDCGGHWRALGLQGQIVKAIAVSGAEPGVAYAGTQPALMFVSRDGGGCWEELTSFRKIFSRRFWFSPAEKPFTAYVQGIALSPTDRKVIVVGIEAGAVVRSDDGGVTWQDHRRGALRDCHSIGFHAREGNWVYEAGGTGGGAAVSRDAGMTWTQRRTGPDGQYGWACAADPADPETWYVSAAPSPARAHGDGNAGAFLYRAKRGGGWEKLGGGLPQPLEHMPYALLTDTEEPGAVYAGLSNGEVWHSADRGDSWARLPFDFGRIHRSMVGM